MYQDFDFFLCIYLLFISVFPSYLNKSHHLHIFQRRLSQSSAVEPLLLIITTKIKVTLIAIFLIPSLHLDVWY